MTTMMDDKRPNERLPNAWGCKDARKTPRAKPSELACSLGTVSDLSQLGMRIECSGKCHVLAGQLMDMTLEAPGGPVSIKCLIMWVKKSDFMRYEVGVQFIEPPPRAAAVLESIAWSDEGRLESA